MSLRFVLSSPHLGDVAAYNAASSNETRTPARIITKDDAKFALKANARLLAGIFQKYPGTTNTHVRSC